MLESVVVGAGVTHVEDALAVVGRRVRVVVDEDHLAGGRWAGRVDTFLPWLVDKKSQYSEYMNRKKEGRPI